jgi:hypothetical protein
MRNARSNRLASAESETSDSRSAALMRVRTHVPSRRAMTRSIQRPLGEVLNVSGPSIDKGALPPLTACGAAVSVEKIDRA